LRKPLIVLALVGVFGALGVAPALAAPPSPVPSVPKNCHEWNALLHIENVRSCDGDPTS
jgi:hypothetical protein